MELHRPMSRLVNVKGHLLGERIDMRNLSLAGWRSVMQTPRVFEGADNSRIAIFRFGAVVTSGAAGSEAPGVPQEIRDKVVGPFERIETEAISVAIAESGDTAIKDGDQFVIADDSPERFSVLANALAKSVALAHDEQRIVTVFEKLEPFARQLAESGDRAVRSDAALKLLGDALLAQHRMVGRVEAHEKPDILWERPDLLRLYARLDEEYELTERARELGRKLKVIEEVARAISDVADARISRRLEMAIVALIMFEIVLSLYTLFFGGDH